MRSTILRTIPVKSRVSRIVDSVDNRCVFGEEKNYGNLEKGDFNQNAMFGAGMGK